MSRARGSTHPRLWHLHCLRSAALLLLPRRERKNRPYASRAWPASDNCELDERDSLSITKFRLIFVRRSRNTGSLPTAIAFAEGPGNRGDAVIYVFAMRDLRGSITSDIDKHLILVPLGLFARQMQSVLITKMPT